MDTTQLLQSWGRTQITIAREITRVVTTLAMIKIISSGNSNSSSNIVSGAISVGTSVLASIRNNQDDVGMVNKRFCNRFA